MKKIILIVLLSSLTTFVFSQELVESTNTKLSIEALKDLEASPFSFEFVEFPIEKLKQLIKNPNKKNTVNVKLGGSINDTWTIEENELRSNYIGVDKWDANGKIKANIEPCETYLAKCNNKNLNIRFAININDELSGFVHDFKSDMMIHFKSISQITTFKDRMKEKNKIAVYTEKFQTNSTQKASTFANLSLPPCSKQWFKIAVETDEEFTSTSIGLFSSILQDVDYIINANLGKRAYFIFKNWNSGMTGYPYNNIPLVTVPQTTPEATRTNESSMFDAFINNGWAKNQSCNMGHLITGRKLRNVLFGNSGGYSNFATACGGTLPLGMSSTEFPSEQIARTMVHEIGHNLAGSTLHDGNCISCDVSSPTNTLMCTFISTGINSGNGCRTIYFSTDTQTAINTNLSNNNSCLLTPTVPSFGQAYYNGVAINSTPFFANSRNGTISINISSNSPESNPTLTASVSPSSVFLGPRNASGSIPNYVGTFTVNAPSSVNNATFTLQSPNICGNSTVKTIPVVFGSAFKLSPNPAQNEITVEFVIDKETQDIELYLPETVILFSDKNKEIKRNDPKKNYLNKLVTDSSKFKWDLTGVENGNYYIHVIYNSNNIIKEKIIIQK